MRFLILAVLMMISNVSFAAEDPQVQMERAKVGFGIFKNVCFMMSPKESWEKRESFLNSKFQKHDADKKDIFLQFTQSKEGEVWAAVFPKGVFIIVVETNGNCHVIAQKADDAVIHEEMKKLADQAQKNLKDVDVVYEPVSEQETRKSSGFEVKKENLVLTAVVATTMSNPPEDKPAALMTVAVAAPSKQK